MVEYIPDVVVDGVLWMRFSKPGCRKSSIPTNMAAECMGREEVEVVDDDDDDDDDDDVRRICLSQILSAPL